MLPADVLVLGDTVGFEEFASSAVTGNGASKLASNVEDITGGVITFAGHSDCVSRVSQKKRQAALYRIVRSQEEKNHVQHHV